MSAVGLVSSRVLRPCVATGISARTGAALSTGVLVDLRLRARRAGLGADTVICLHVNNEGKNPSACLMCTVVDT